MGYLFLPQKQVLLKANIPVSFFDLMVTPAKMVQFKYRNKGRFLLVKFVSLPASTLQEFNLKLGERNKDYLKKR